MILTYMINPQLKVQFINTKNYINYINNSLLVGIKTRHHSGHHSPRAS